MTPTKTAEGTFLSKSISTGTSPRQLSWVVLGLVFGGLLLSGSAGAAEFERGDWRLELNGQNRLLGTFSRQLDAERFLVDTLDMAPPRALPTRSDSGLLLNRTRLTAEAAWRDRFSAQLSYDHEARTGSGLDSLGFALGDLVGTGTGFDLDRTYSRHDNVDARHQIYRAWARYEGERLTLTLGRQRIALGRTRLWNPTDLFNPIFPLQIEGTQRIGQDALVARWKLAEELWTEVIWAPQRDADESRVAGRVEWIAQAWEGSLMLGRFERDYLIGGDFARNLGDAAMRLEASFTDLAAGGRIWQAVASLDYTFPVGNGVYALIEHLYNENRGFDFGNQVLTALPALPPQTLEQRLKLVESLIETPGFQVALDRFPTQRALHLTGFQFSYEMTSLISGSLLVLADWDGPSTAIFPALTYVPWDDVEVTLGTQLFVGPSDRSEFGDAANVVFLQLDLYF